VTWSGYLRKLAVAVTGAAAGTVATSLTANPALGAAAGTAATKSAEQLITELLPAQQEALQAIEERTRQIYSLLAGVDTRVRALQSAPWRVALLNIEDAVHSPAEAPMHLERARQSLYEAWGSGTDDDERAFVAQLLSVVFALLGADAQSGRWLIKSYAPAVAARNAMIGSLFESVRALKPERWPVLNDFRPPRTGYLHVTPETFGGGKLKTGDTRRVRSDLVLPALRAAAATTVEVARLWQACSVAGMSGTYPVISSMDPGYFAGDDKVSAVALSGRFDGTSPTLSIHLATDDHAAMRESFSPAVHLSFSLSSDPHDADRSVYVSGDCPELGGGRPRAAVPLGIGGVTLWVLRPASGSIRYAYGTRDGPGGAWRREPGAVRVKDLPMTGLAMCVDQWRS
jgi:hypothetical protein